MPETKYPSGFQSAHSGELHSNSTVARRAAALSAQPVQDKTSNRASAFRQTSQSTVTASKIKTEIVRIHPAVVTPGPHRHSRKNQLRALGVLLIAAQMVLAVGFPSLKVGGPATTESTAMATRFAPVREETATPEPVRAPTWSVMTESQQTDFIAAQSQRVSAMLGENPHPLSDEAVKLIRKYVDAYAKRTAIPAHGGGAENLRSLFARASSYAPVIVRSFKERRVPPVMGLYIPLIESEYRACVQSQYGAKGLFQFMPASARAYGANAGDLCNAEKMAPVAAKYIADRMTEFGTDAKSMTLVLMSFNRNPDIVRRDLMQLRRADPDLDRSFWSLFANAHKLDSYFRNESRYYVPKFYAAAIVGENPQTFGLEMPPLSLREQ